MQRLAASAPVSAFSARFLRGHRFRRVLDITGIASIAFFVASSGSVNAETPRFLGLARPTAFVLLDVNRDGAIDVVTANETHNTVSVLLGDGTGRLNPVTVLRSPGNHLEIDSGDLNGDGISDVAMPTDTGRVALLLGDGVGSFRQGGTYKVFDSAVFDVALIDLSGDGRPEIVATDPVKDAIGILRAAADGTFVFAGTFSAGAAADLNTADLNADGHADIVASGAGLSLLFGDGRGSFASVARYLGDFAPLGETEVTD